MNETIEERIDRRCKMSLVSDVVKASRRKEERLWRAIFRQPALPPELALALALAISLALPPELALALALELALVLAISLALALALIIALALG